MEGGRVTLKPWPNPAHIPHGQAKGLQGWNTSSDMLNSRSHPSPVAPRSVRAPPRKRRTMPHREYMYRTSDTITTLCYGCYATPQSMCKRRRVRGVVWLQMVPVT